MLTLSWAITTTYSTHLLSIAGHLVSLSFRRRIPSAELLFSFRSAHILYGIERRIQWRSSSHCRPRSLKKQAWIIFQGQLHATAANSSLGHNIDFVYLFRLVGSNLFTHYLKITSKKLHCSLQPAETHTLRQTNGILASSSRGLRRMRSTSVVAWETFPVPKSLSPCAWYLHHSR